jgi:hypothetical protein
MGVLGSQVGNYDVSVTTKSQSRERNSSNGSNVPNESEEDLKRKDSDELLIMSQGKGIMKVIDVSVHR